MLYTKKELRRITNMGRWVLNSYLKEYEEKGLISVIRDKKHPKYDVPDEIVEELKSKKTGHIYDKNLLTSNEVKYELGISDTTLRRWIKNRKITPIDIAPDTKMPRYRFQKSEIKKLREEENQLFDKIIDLCKIYKSKGYHLEKASRLIAKKINKSQSRVKAIIHQYEKSEGEILPRAWKPISEEKKMKIYLDSLNNERDEIIKKYGISTTEFYRIRNQYQKIIPDNEEGFISYILNVSKSRGGLDKLTDSEIKRLNYYGWEIRKEDEMLVLQRIKK
jgi:transposase-like protein